LEAGQAETLEEVAGVYFKRKEYDKAVEYFAKALSLQAMLGNRQQLAYIHKSLGAIHAQKGLYQKALQSYLKGLEMERSLQDLVGQAGTYYSIARIYEKMQQYEKAINYMKKTVALDRKTNDPNLHSDKRYLQQLQEQLKTRMAAGNASPEESASPPLAPNPSPPGVQPLGSTY
jgi:tetratricopeptide (TPR) repeat protein